MPPKPDPIYADDIDEMELEAFEEADDLENDNDELRLNAVEHLNWDSDESDPELPPAYADQDLNPPPGQRNPEQPQPATRYICSSVSVEHQSDIEYFSMLGPNQNIIYLPTLVYRPVYERRWMSPVIDGFVNPQMGDDQKPDNVNFEANIPNDAEIPEPSIDTGLGSTDRLSNFDDDDGIAMPPNVEDNQLHNPLPNDNNETSNPNIQFSLLNNGQYAYHHPNFSHPLPCYFGTSPANPSFPTMQPATPYVSLNYSAPAKPEAFNPPNTDQQDFDRTNIYVGNSTGQFNFISLDNQQGSCTNSPNLSPHFLPNPASDPNYYFYSSPNSPPKPPVNPVHNTSSNSFNSPNSSNIPPNHPQNPSSNSTPNHFLNSQQFHSSNLQPQLYPMYAHNSHHPQYPQDSPHPQYPPQHSPDPQYPQYIPNQRYSQNLQFPQYPYNPEISHNSHNPQSQYIPNPVHTISPNRSSNFPPPRLPNLSQNACCPSTCCDGDICCQHHMCALKRRNNKAKYNNAEQKLSKNFPEAKNVAEANQLKTHTSKTNPLEPSLLEPNTPKTNPPKSAQNQNLVNKRSLVETPCCSVICCDSSCCQHSNCKKKNRPSEQNNMRKNNQASPENSPEKANSSAAPQNGNMINRNSNPEKISCCSVICCKSSCCQHSNCTKKSRLISSSNLPDGKVAPIKAFGEFSCCPHTCCLISCCTHLNCNKYKSPQPQRTPPAIKGASRHINETPDNPDLYNSRHEITIHKTESSTSCANSENLATCAEVSEKRMKILECQSELSGSARQPDGHNMPRKLSCNLIIQDSNKTDQSKPAYLKEQSYKIISTRTMPKPVFKHSIPISITVVKSQISSPFRMVEQHDRTLRLVAQYNSDDTDNAIHTNIKLPISIDPKSDLSQEDFLTAKAINKFPSNICINSEGNILLEFAFKLFVEITRDFGIRMSCPKHKIFLATSAETTYVGLFHPDGRLYNNDHAMDMQSPYINSVNRLAKITADGKCFFVSTDSPYMFEISETEIKQLSRGDFLDLDNDFTKSILLSEGHHGPSEANTCLNIVEKEGMIKFGDNKDELVIRNIRISQTHDGNLTLCSGGKIRLQLSPENRSCRINTPSYRAKAYSRKKGINFFYEDKDHRMISCDKNFILRTKKKSGGFDDKNKLQQCFKKIIAEPSPMFKN